MRAVLIFRVLLPSLPFPPYFDSSSPTTANHEKEERTMLSAWDEFEDGAAVCSKRDFLLLNFCIRSSLKVEAAAAAAFFEVEFALFSGESSKRKLHYGPGSRFICSQTKGKSFD
jgi:hypothetical protein